MNFRPTEARGSAMPRARPHRTGPTSRHTARTGRSPLTGLERTIRPELPREQARDDHTFNAPSVCSQAMDDRADAMRRTGIAPAYQRRQRLAHRLEVGQLLLNDLQ